MPPLILTTLTPACTAPGSYMIQLLHGGDRLNTSLCVDADTGVRPYGEHDSGTGVSALYPVTKVLERTRSKWQVRAVVKCENPTPLQQFSLSPLLMTVGASLVSRLVRCLRPTSLGV